MGRRTRRRRQGYKGLELGQKKYRFQTTCCFIAAKLSVLLVQSFKYFNGCIQLCTWMCWRVGGLFLGKEKGNWDYDKKNICLYFCCDICLSLITGRIYTITLPWIVKSQDNRTGKDFEQSIPCTSLRASIWIRFLIDGCPTCFLNPSQIPPAIYSSP